MNHIIETSADIRSSNKHKILKHILNHGPISRAEISRRLKLSKSVTTEITADLVAKRIIFEKPSDNHINQVGRRPILLSFNADYRHFISIDLNQELTMITLANLKGQILRKISIFIERDESFEQRFDKLRRSIESLCTPNVRLSMIAISSPGVFFDKEEDYFVNLQFQHWQIGGLIRDLKRYFNVNVDVYNDVNAAIVGEHTYGVAKNIRNFVYISIGLGLGSAIMLNNTLYEGPNKSAGEIGDFRFSNNTRLEDLVNLNALKLFFQQHTTKTFDDMNSFKLFETIMLNEFQEIRHEFIVELGKLMGRAINNIISLLDVELIVLGGMYEPFYDEMIPIIEQQLGTRNFNLGPVKKSELKEKAGIYGLIALSVENELVELAYNE